MDDTNSNSVNFLITYREIANTEALLWVKGLDLYNISQYDKPLRQLILL